VNRDFANKNRGTSKKQSASASPRRREKTPPQPPWTWFLAGLVCGVFLAALIWLASQQPDPALVAEGPEGPASQQARPGPRFDFYTLLPEQRIEVEVEPEALATATPDEPLDQFLLQAGSFKKAEDADRRRAELLLLGLNAAVEEASTDNGRWFRVYIGPFESRSRLARARSVTAQQGIDTLVLKRPGNAG
jgi:cell division protein FtsN